MQFILYALLLYFVYFALNHPGLADTAAISKKKGKNSSMNFLLCLLALFVLRLILAAISPGYSTDANCFLAWARRLAEVGTQNFYQEDYFADYPPLYMIVLWPIGLLLRIFDGEAALRILLRLPAMICDCVLAVILVSAAREENAKNGNSLAYLFLLCPAVLINSAVWGQIDSVFTLPLLLVILFLQKKRWSLCALCFSLAALIKPQAFLFAPVFLAGYLRRAGWRDWLASVGIGFGALFLAALPFTRGFDFSWIFEKYFATLASYPYASVNAYNIYALAGMNWAAQDAQFLFLPVWVWTYIVILGATLGTIYFCMKSERPSRYLYGAVTLVTVLFSLSGKMHERYLYPILIMLLLCYLMEKRRTLLYQFMAVSTVHFLNVGYVLALDIVGKGESIKGSQLIIGIISLLQLAVMCWILWEAVTYYLPGLVKEKTPRELTCDRKMGRKDHLLMWSVTAVYAVVALVQLGGFSAPQTFYTFTDGAVVLDYGEEITPTGGILYSGSGDKGCEYTLSVSDDGTEYREAGKLPHATSFQWSRFEVSESGRYWRIESPSAKQMLGEFCLFGAEGQPILPVQSHVLTDEYDTLPEKISHMTGAYFDEIYHPRTAYEILNRLPVYETTHPPLGKVIQSIGIWIFGMTPFGWRIMGTLAGVLMLPLLYFIAKRLFGGTGWALMAQLLFTFDFMHFSQTRIGTIDSYCLLFILLAYAFLICYWQEGFDKAKYRHLFLGGVAFGLAAASKWVGVYSAAGIAVIMIVYWVKEYLRCKREKENWFVPRMLKTLGICAVAFVLIPALIYGASYLPQMRYDLRGRTMLEYFWGNQTHMFGYHEGVTSDHPYGSSTISWPLIYRPLWAYQGRDGLAEGMAASITVLGNPLIWWTGLVAILCLCYIAVRKRSFSALLPLAGYGAQYLPWFLIGRVLFIYHYFAAVPFLCLAIVYVVRHLYGRGWLTWRSIGIYTAVCGLLFVLFYPGISGMTVPGWYLRLLEWLPSWVFIAG